jgi:pre-mRNA-splicing helicase BRR2
VLGTTRNRDEAVQWLGYTYCTFHTSLLFFFSGLSYLHADMSECSGRQPCMVLEQIILRTIKKRADIIHSAAILLGKCQLVKYERSTGRFTSTDLRNKDEQLRAVCIERYQEMVDLHVKGWALKFRKLPRREGDR